MSKRTIICGAGIAGIATAYYLSVKLRRKNIVLVDKLLPMSLTTSQSGENYRDYWPQACMSQLSGHSIDLMEELANLHGDVFDMRNFGYQFVSQIENQDIFGEIDSKLASGVQRCSDASQIHRQHGYLSTSVKQIVTIPRAGAIDVYAMGSLLLREARVAGITMMQAEVIGLSSPSTGGFQVEFHSSRPFEQMYCDQLVLCAGPFNRNIAMLLGIDLPLESIPQRKFVIPDPLGIIPVNMPFTICANTIRLKWSTEDREMLQADPDYHWLLEELPAGLHIKPESRGFIKLGWAFNRQAEEPGWNIPEDVTFPDVVMRGATSFIPKLQSYADTMPTPIVQYAGYYTRTKENLPLIGPLALPGLFTVAGLSGFGTMTGCAAGELCALHITEGELPAYARHFHPDRASDFATMLEISATSSDGQL